jgi:hypothetical protein
MPKDKVAEDYKFFRDHFYPEKETESTPAAKPCPTCGCKIHKIIDVKGFVNIAVTKPMKMKGGIYHVNHTRR